MHMSSNTQAILLLTAPLLVGKGGAVDSILTCGEYKLLARRLRELGREPADLLGADGTSLIQSLRPVIPADRLQRLLDRGFQLSQAVERWTSRAIWVLSRADERYPRRLKARCKEDAPPVLYGCGEVRLLDTGGLAVVGSRDVDDENNRFTQQVASLAAMAGRTIVSGGARGVDRAAMGGALDSGGRATGVLADSLDRAALNRENREFLIDSRLVLISPFDPSAGFNVGNAMQRNKYIYALADAALVVKSDFQKGGTWNGAQEQLERYRYVPVYVGVDQSRGTEALKRMGAFPWPNPDNPSALERVFATQSPLGTDSVDNDELPLFAREKKTQRQPEAEPTGEQLVNSVRGGKAASGGNAEAIFSKIREILQDIDHPMTDAQIAEDLGVTLVQAREWLKRLTTEGTLEKTKRPVRYQTPTADLTLFSTGRLAHPENPNRPKNAPVSLHRQAFQNQSRVGDTMSGRKQHFIPQFLQRGFALSNSGGEWQAWVYRKDRAYKSNTKDIGVERDFYVAGDLDADGPITGAESGFAALLKWLRDHEPGAVDRTEEIARLIVHLETRTAQLREMHRSDAQFGCDEILRALDDPATFTRLFQEHAPEQRREFARVIETLKHRGLWLPMIEHLRLGLRTSLERAVQQGQVKVLAADVAPVQRVQELMGLEFRVSTSSEELVLGDSAVFFKVRELDDFRPFRDKGVAIHFVALPLTPSKVLLGGTALPETCPTGLLMAAIKCSHDFFISPKERKDFSQAATQIGSNAILLSDSEKMDIIADLLKN